MARILLLTPYEPPPDGIAKHSSELVDAWDAAGHNVLVLSPRSRHAGSEKIASNSKVERVLTPFSGNETSREIIDFEPDVAIVQFAIAAFNINVWPVMRLCKVLRTEGVPVVVTFHEPAREFNLLGFVTRFVYRSMARVTDVPVVFSDAGHRALLDTNLFTNVVQVSHGTRGVTPIADERIREVRLSYAIVKPLVLTLGFTNFDKGVDVLLDASRTISEQADQNVQFLIAGAPRRRRGFFRLMELRDIRCQRRLVIQSKSLDEESISFHGYVPSEDLPALLHTADVLVLPYRSITQSGIASLALSSRAVVVCSDLPGLRSDLGDAALYVPAGNSKALAAQVASLLGDGRETERSRLRDRAEKRASENTYAKVAEQILVAGLARPRDGA